MLVGYLISLPFKNSNKSIDGLTIFTIEKS